jgi:DNA-binding protein H-NS
VSAFTIVAYLVVDVSKKKAKKPKRATIKLMSKICNPANSIMTWSGKGRQTVWFSDAVAGGGGTTVGDAG